MRASFQLAPRVRVHVIDPVGKTRAGLLVRDEAAGSLLETTGLAAILLAVSTSLEVPAAGALPSGTNAIPSPCATHTPSCALSTLTCMTRRLVHTRTVRKRDSYCADISVINLQYKFVKYSPNLYHFIPFSSPAPGGFSLLS